MTVIDFPTNQIWVCLCGCLTFNLRRDGSTECAACGNREDGGTWTDKADSGYSAPATQFSRIVSEQDEVFTRARYAKLVKSSPDLCVVALVDADGRVRVWQARDLSPRAERGWLNRALKSARDMLVQ